MIKTLDYKIEESTSSVELSKFVLEKLNNGYDLLGRPFPREGYQDKYGNKHHKGTICQCVVKVDKSDEFEKVKQVINSFIDIDKGEKKPEKDEPPWEE